MDTRTLPNRREWTCRCIGQKGCQNYTNTYQRNILPFYQTTFKTGVLKVYTDITRDKVIPKTMEARNNQNTRLATKIGRCRISIVRWVWLSGYTPSPHWNQPRPLLHASANPWTETIYNVTHYLLGESVSDTEKPGQKLWKTDFASFLLLFL